MGKIGFKVMLGVVEGYGHDNQELTPSEAKTKGERVWGDVVQNVSGMRIDPENPESEYLYNIGESIISAIAVYSTNFGCPEGGEVGIQAEGEMEEGQDYTLYRMSVQETVKEAMALLKQTTATIEWSKDGKGIGTTYFSNGGEDKQDNAPTEENEIEHFTVLLGNGTQTDEEYKRIGRAIQNASEKVSKQKSDLNTGDNFYMISGLLTPESENGIQYGASQNPGYGQTNGELYRHSVIATIKEVMKDLQQKFATIRFNNETVSLDLSEIEKDAVMMDEIEQQ